MLCRYVFSLCYHYDVLALALYLCSYALFFFLNITFNALTCSRSLWLCTYLEPRDARLDRVVQCVQPRTLALAAATSATPKMLRGKCLTFGVYSRELRAVDRRR